MRLLTRLVARQVVAPFAHAEWKNGPSFAKPLGRCLGAALLAVGLAGCLARPGLGPILDATSVETASNNTQRVLIAFAADASLGSSASDWYLVTQAGFNYIDDQCKAYFYGPVGGGPSVAAAGAVTAALLALTGAPAMSLPVLAQVLGLSVNATEAAAGPGQLPPGTYDLVQHLQTNYRLEAVAHRARINTPTAAYRVLQRYLDLCLPARIKTEITVMLRGGRSHFPADIASGPATAVVVRTSGPVVVGGGAVGGVLGRPSRPMRGGTEEKRKPTEEAPRGPEESDPIRVGAFERGLFAGEISDFQKAICLRVDGQFTTETRNAILAFLKSKNLKDQGFPDRITAEDGIRLRRSLREDPRC